MIISEKQITKLIMHLKDFQIILAQSYLEESAYKYNKIRDLFDEITNQQSEELKDWTNEKD
jgi:hypothetical protein